jgi:tRNA-guanine family transglycosylase
MNELSAHRLLTIHNLTYVLDLVCGARAAIEGGRFSRYVAEVRELRGNGSTYVEPPS